MQTTREIRRRIRTVLSIQQITRAMEMVAASRFKRVSGQVLKARPYRTLMHQLLQDIVVSAPHIHHPLLVRREPRTVCLMVITSDRGLCGAYNANILRGALHFITSLQGAEIRLILIGRKGYDFFARRGYQIDRYEPQPPLDASFRLAQDIINVLTRGYEEKRFDGVHLFYTQFKTAMSSPPSHLALLPMEKPAAMKDIQSLGEPLFEPAPEELMASFMPRYLESQVYGALLESTASEQGARMVAMRNAEENADEMIADLTLTYHKARQASITREILEVISGAEAFRV
jgi:F-type H+-transporting ATPase subunit gamma